ncbi:hypothetical protein ACFOET_06925 [Parapedobacter deserti]|uniref:Type II secretion system protein M n=1 Tax=Parapedobacter deserti TaxID=1912957 RepID=A0ABV7JGW5_9SPHI
MIAFFDRYDWRIKNRLLWAVAALFLVACYQLAVKPTLALRREYHVQRAGEAKRQANLLVLDQLRDQARRAGRLFAVDTSATGDTALSEPERIALMAQHCGVHVRSLPAPERLGAETLHLYYTEYQLGGGFEGLLRLLRDVEGQQGINLLSASFVKRAHSTTRAPELLLQLRTVRLAKN